VLCGHPRHTYSEYLVFVGEPGPTYIVSTWSSFENRVLHMVLPRRRWDLSLVGEEGDNGWLEGLSVPLGGLPCSRCCAEVDGMESSDQIGILPLI
jgi:hypothetical protein